jgi:hypothetical protein
LIRVGTDNNCPLTDIPDELIATLFVLLPTLTDPEATTVAIVICELFTVPFTDELPTERYDDVRNRLLVVLPIVIVLPVESSTLDDIVNTVVVVEFPPLIDELAVSVVAVNVPLTAALPDAVLESTVIDLVVIASANSLVLSNQN